jgi:hypothetical protein
MKVVINTCYGGYNLSQKAVDLYVQRSGLKLFRSESGGYTTIPTEAYDKLVKEEDQQWQQWRQNRETFTGHKSNRFTWGQNKIQRNDDLLVSIVQELGTDANDGTYSKLKVVEIPDDVQFIIQDYDGCEWIAEKHRTWR